MPFKPATKEVGFVKGSMFGPKGTGKTTLLAMLLIHLSKTYHNSAPVAWLASEKGVDFVLDIFKAEGVPLLLNRSRSAPYDAKNYVAKLARWLRRAVKAGLDNQAASAVWDAAACCAARLTGTRP